MRILLLAQWYDPIIGGEESHVRTLARALVDRGHDVAVATLAYPGRDALELDGGVRVHRLKAAVQGLPGLFTSPGRQSVPSAPDPILAVGLRRVVRSERPDLVHAHNWIAFSYLPVRDKNSPMLLTVHDTSLVCAKKNLMYRGAVCSGPAPRKCLGCTAHHYGLAKGSVTLGGLWGLRPHLFRAISCFVAVSDAVVELNGLARLGLRHRVIPNFLPDDIGELGSESHPPRGLPEAPYFLFVGSLSRYKGIAQLLQAYAGLEVRDRPPLVLIGYRGSEPLSELDNLPAGVVVVQDQPRAAVLAACRGALCGIVPSILPEAFGMVALEAMAFAKPVIASRIGGLPEVVVDGETGILVDPGDVDALAGAMTRVAVDVALARRLGRAGQDRAATFSVSQVLPKIEELYTVEIARHRQGGRRMRGSRVDAGLAAT